MKERSLRIGETECSLLLGDRLVERLDEILTGAARLNGPVVLITDENVARCQGHRLPANIARIAVAAGEGSKSLSTFASLIEELLDKGMDRTGTIVAFGGGVVGDLAGFAAATFMRGVRWVNVPTTLLAMVDASIGGKTAVNIERAKNIVGAFHAPSTVVADPTVLGTLPPAERSSGMAEVIKHALIASKPLFERLEQGTFGSLKDIAEAMEVKAAIVERDPFERGERALLNLGHTVGHGFETASGYRLSHGQAVAIGLVAEARIAEEMGLAASGLAERIAAVATLFELPTRFPLEVKSVRDAMSVDKKRVGRRVRFALPKDVGEAVFGIEVEERLLMKVLTEVCEG